MDSHHKPHHMALEHCHQLDQQAMMDLEANRMASTEALTLMSWETRDYLFRLLLELTIHMEILLDKSFPKRDD